MLRGDEISNQIEGKNGRVANVEIHTGQKSICKFELLLFSLWPL